MSWDAISLVTILTNGIVAGYRRIIRSQEAHWGVCSVWLGRWCAPEGKEGVVMWCVCVCMCTCVYVYVCMCICMCMCVSVRVYVGLCMCV